MSDKAKLDTSKPTKHDLLIELESIRASLSEQEARDELDIESIPVLNDTIPLPPTQTPPPEEAHTGDSLDDETQLRAAYKSTLEAAENLVGETTAPLGYDPEDYEFELKLEGIIEEEANALADTPDETAAADISQDDTQTRIEVQKLEHERKQAQNKDDEPDYEQALAALAETPLLDEAPLPPLPGQQSLFDEHADKAHDEHTNAEAPSMEKAPQPNGAHPADKSDRIKSTQRSKEPSQATLEQADAFEATAKASEEPEEEPYVRPKAHGENPFLPQHIRERLTSSRNQLMEDLAEVDNTLKKPPSAHGKPSAFNRKEGDQKTTNKEAEQIQKEIIDQLVEKFLPEIEAELRAHIEQRLLSAKGRE